MRWWPEAIVVAVWAGGWGPHWQLPALPFLLGSRADSPIGFCTRNESRCHLVFVSGSKTSGVIVYERRDKVPPKGWCCPVTRVKERLNCQFSWVLRVESWKQRRGKLESKATLPFVLRNWTGLGLQKPHSSLIWELANVVKICPSHLIYCIYSIFQPLFFSSLNAASQDLSQLPPETAERFSYPSLEHLVIPLKRWGCLVMSVRYQRKMCEPWWIWTEVVPLCIFLIS